MKIVMNYDAGVEKNSKSLTNQQPVLALHKKSTGRGYPDIRNFHVIWEKRDIRKNRGTEESCKDMIFQKRTSHLRNSPVSGHLEFPCYPGKKGHSKNAGGTEEVRKVEKIMIFGKNKDIREIYGSFSFV